MVRRYFLITAVLAAVGTGCADDGTSLRIECPIPPEDVTDTACTYNADTDTCVLSGLLNLSIAREYQLVLKVANGLSSRESNIPLRPEPNNMDVTSAEVTLVSTAGEVLDFGELPNPFSVSSSGRVPINGTGVASIQAIPPDYIQSMRDNGFESEHGTIVIRVVVNARTDGDVSVTSRKWRWPVDLVVIEPGPNDCIPADDARVQCTLGQDFEFLPFCSNLSG